MPATPPTKFFTTYRGWQWIKHQILSEYITRWARMVGSFAPKIHIVDTFAGAGHYDGPGGDKVEGSPIIEARACQVYNSQFSGQSRTMDLFCIEADHENFRKLGEALTPFGGIVKTRDGDYFTHIPEVLQVIKADPTLILFDPIGLKPITANRCRPLLARAGKTDVFVVVDFQIIHRTAGQMLPNGDPNPAHKTASALIANLDGFFNTTDWRPIAVSSKFTTGEKERLYLDLYFRHVLGMRYRFQCAYPVRGRVGAPPQYWIVNASNSVRALWLMNDCLASVDPKLMQKTVTAPNQLTGFVDAFVEAYQIDVEREFEGAMIAVLQKADGALSFGKVSEALLAQFFGRVHESTYARVAKRLVKNGRLRRQQRAAAKLDQAEILSLPTV